MSVVDELDPRQDAETPERRLWQVLRDGRLQGLTFRRQAPIGPFIVDFFCPSARLVVEVDRRAHVASAQDRLRDAWLARDGVTVLRVWTSEVKDNLDAVRLRIAAAAARETPLTLPAPVAGEGLGGA